MDGSWELILRVLKVSFWRFVSFWGEVSLVEILVLIIGEVFLVKILRKWWNGVVYIWYLEGGF